MENYEGQKRRKMEGQSATTELTFLIENAHAGAVIGKQASQLKQIRESTGARVTVAKEKIPPNDDRVLKIEAPTLPVALAGLDACLALVGLDTPSAPVKLTVLLPPSDIGRLVGKGGDNINRIRAESKAEIMVHKKTELIDNTHGYCVATGTPEAMAAAVRLIAAFLYELFNKDDALAATQRLTVPSIDPAAMQAQHQAAMFQQAGMQGEAGMAAQYQQMSGMPMMGASPMMGMPVSSSVRGGNRVILELPVAKAYFGLVLGKGGRLINQTRTECPSVEIKADDKEPRVQSDTGVPLASLTVTGGREDVWDAAQRLARHFFAGNDEETAPASAVLELPRDVVSKIIGKKGSRIKAIREASRALIKIVTPEDASLPASITIEGTGRQVASARMLVEAVETYVAEPS